MRLCAKDAPIRWCETTTDRGAVPSRFLLGIGELANGVILRPPPVRGAPAGGRSGHLLLGRGKRGFKVSSDPQCCAAAFAKALPRFRSARAQVARQARLVALLGGTHPVPAAPSVQTNPAKSREGWLSIARPRHGSSGRTLTREHVFEEVAPALRSQ
jgi:hypothetical protein